MLLGPLKGVKDVLFNVTGIGASGGVGSLFAGTVTEVNPVGVQALAQLGSANSTVSASTLATGVGATGQVSAVNASAVLEVPVTGVQASTQVSPVTTTTISNVSVTLTGVAGSAQTGSSSIIIESGAFPLPADAVLIWGASGSPAPAGFTIMDTGAEDHLIMGAATIAQANTFTSTAGTLSGSATSFSAGTHSTPWSPAGANPSGSGTPGTNQAGSAGSHNHSVTFTPTAIPTATLPGGQGIKLITNASEVSEIPQDAVMFCDSIKTGFERKTWTGNNNVYIARKNSVSTNAALGAVAKSFNLVVASGGAHQHNSPTTTGPNSIIPGRVRNVSAGAHTHPVSTPSLNLFIFQYYKHLLPFIATTDSAVRSGMIVMFKGASVPAGWSFCDGTGDTPDMRSYFIGYNNNIDTTDNIIGQRAAKASATAPPAGGNTSSTYTPTPISATLNTITWPHSHAGTPQNTTGQQPHFHATRSVPHSHPVSGMPLTVPSSFLPNTFRLAFIRKD